LCNYTQNEIACCYKINKTILKKDKFELTEYNAARNIIDLLAKLEFIATDDVQKENNRIDIVATKGSNSDRYSIAFEVVRHHSLSQSLAYGSKTLSNVARTMEFDKLVLVLLKNMKPNVSEEKLIKSFEQNNPTGFEIIDYKDIENWATQLNRELTRDNEAAVMLKFKNLSKELITMVAKNEHTLKHLEWRDVERLAAEVFEGLGFDVQLTPSSKDGGKDVILTLNTGNAARSFIIEIKHWRSNQLVGSNHVKKFTKVIVKEKRDRGLLLSTYGFNKNYYECLTESEEKIISFGGKEKLVELCRTYERIQAGLMLPVSSLETELFRDTIKYA